MSAATGGTSVSSAQSLNAERAVQSYQAMQTHFYAGDGSSLYRATPGASAAQGYTALWDFTRAHAATLDLAGVPRSLVAGFDVASAVADRAAGLARYWDSAAHPPGYESAALPPHGKGGDKYYDDNAWVGLALVQQHRLQGDQASLAAAKAVFAYILSGWDTDASHPVPGGLFWVNQGRGAGLTDHTRHTISNAPNAELGLHLHELTGDASYDGGAGRIGAGDMYQWVNDALDQSKGTNQAGTGLYFDNLAPSGAVQPTLWTYNQGVMIGANVLRHRLIGPTDSQFLPRAETIAYKALAYFVGNYDSQPEQFNAIFFRNLLLLYAVSGDAVLKESILSAINGYADDAWQSRRDSNGLFPASQPELIKHAGMVQIFATLAWDPGGYQNLA